MRHAIHTLALTIPLAWIGCEPADTFDAGPNAPLVVVDQPPALSLPTVWVLVHPTQSDAPGLYRIDLERPTQVLEFIATPERLTSPQSVAFDIATDELIVAGYDALSSPLSQAVRAVDGALVDRRLPAAIEVAFDDDGVLWFATDAYFDRLPARPDGYQLFDVPSGLTALLIVDGEFTTVVNGARDWLQSWDADWTPTSIEVLPESLVATSAAVAWQDALLVAQQNTVSVVRNGVVERTVVLPVGPWVTGLTIDSRLRD